MNSIFNFLDKIASAKIAYFIILIFAVTVYSRCLSYGFVDFDDKQILQNLDVAGISKSPVEAFKRDAFLTTGGRSFYRPMQGLTYIMDYSIKGIDPISYHVTNLSIHILTCMGLFFLLKMLGFERGLSFLMTVLFAVHPLFNQAVAWIPARGDLLIGLFGIISLITYMKYLEENSCWYFAAHLSAFLAATFSKETAILFPILYGLFYYFRYYGRAGTKFNNIKNLALISGWILTVGIYLYMRSTVIKTSFTTGEFGIFAFLSNIWAIPEYIAKFFIPINLSGMPEFSVLVSSIGILIMAVMAIFTIVNRKNFNYLSFIGIVWFVIFTAVSMTYRHGHGKAAYDYLEHRAYLPSMGLIIFILSFITEVRKVRLVCVLMPLIFVYSVYTFVNTKKFENPMSFHNSVIEAGSTVAGAYFNRANIRLRNGDNKGAIEDYSKAISIKSDYVEAYNNKGNIERDMKEYERAIDDYTKAIKAKPAHVGAYSNRGDIFFKMNRREDAIADYNRAIEIDPKYSGSYNNLGILYASEGDYLESIKYFTKAIECDNKFGNAYMNRGLAYLFLGDKRKACENFKLSMEFGCDAGKQLYEKHRLTPE
jgi:tetratricopeptide (TPR) repeat protein